MKYNIHKTINVFALLLSVQYLLNLVWMYFFRSYLSELLIENQNPYIEYVAYIPNAFTIIFNIVYMVIVYSELKKHDIKSILIILITLFFGFIGIALFFILLIYNLYVNKYQSTTQK